MQPRTCPKWPRPPSSSPDTKLPPLGCPAITPGSPRSSLPTSQHAALRAAVPATCTGCPGCSRQRGRQGAPDQQRSPATRGQAPLVSSTTGPSRTAPAPRTGAGPPCTPFPTSSLDWASTGGPPSRRALAPCRAGDRVHGAVTTAWRDADATRRAGQQQLRHSKWREEASRPLRGPGEGQQAPMHAGYATGAAAGRCPGQARGPEPPGLFRSRLRMAARPRPARWVWGGIGASAPTPFGPCSTQTLNPTVWR